MEIETVCARGSQLFDPQTGAISAPIYQSATFRHPSLGESTGFDYSRSENPTRDILERSLALLERAEESLAFSSGMGAISCLAKLFAPGDHIAVSDDLYGGTYRLFNGYYSRYGLEFSWIDTSDLTAVKSTLRSNTKALFIETPSNPMMKITDIKACADLIHSRGGLLIADNTFLTPYFQNPLDLGADFVIHSASKYLSGHNDVLAGFIAHSNAEFSAALRDAQKSEGACLSPFDSWLVLRGMKTLALRMEKHQENGKAVAEFLRSHPKVERVFYTGFSDHAALGQARGHNGMISFYVKNSADAAEVLRRVKLILFAESLGGVESLITYPIAQTHGSIPENLRLATGINDRLLRLSVGIESANDLIADLERALR